MPMAIQAEEINHINIESNDAVINRIDDFFLTQPTKKSVIWTPKIKGKSRYAFSIPKNAYLLSKNYADASDLFYLSNQIDSGLKFHQNNKKNIDLIISENYSNIILNQSISSSTNAALFFKKKQKISYGLNFNKDVIILKNTLGNFGIEQPVDGRTVFNAKFVKLSNNENSEFYGIINHEYNSDHVNMGIGNTWFEILNQFDFTVGLKKQEKKFEPELYASFGYESIKFQLGLDQIKNSSKMNTFFNLKFENNLLMKKLGTNVIVTSRDSLFGLRKLSLKSFRKKNLDILWKKYINYN